MVEIEYYENGNVMYEIPHKNDEKHGVEKGYYENGNVWYETPFVKGKRHGVAKGYDENGNLIKEIIYENGELVTPNIWLGVTAENQRKE